MEQKLFKEEKVMYSLSMQIGTWPEEACRYTLLLSPDKDKIENAMAELNKAVRDGFEQTKKFFDKYGITNEACGGYLDESCFEEMFRGKMFMTYIEKFGETKSDQNIIHIQWSRL